MAKSHNLNTDMQFQNKVKKGFTTVIIPVYKDIVGLSDTLQSLKSQTLSQSKFEVIVTNDGADPTISEVCSQFKVIEIKNSPNGGAYVARNLALEQSRGEYIAFTDADVQVPADWLEQGLKHLQKYDYIGGPINIDTTKVETISHHYELHNAFNVEGYFKHSHYFPTANMFTKRKVFEQVGCFDQRLKSSGDKEFGTRVFENNLASKYISDLSVIHPPRNFKQIIKKMNRVEKGKKQLYALYPTRFKNLKTDIFNELRYAIFNIPGINPNSAEADIKLQIMTFKYLLQYIYLYYRIKYYI